MIILIPIVVMISTVLKFVFMGLGDSPDFDSSREPAGVTALQPAAATTCPASRLKQQPRAQTKISAITRVIKSEQS